MMGSFISKNYNNLQLCITNSPTFAIRISYLFIQQKSKGTLLDLVAYISNKTSKKVQLYYTMKSWIKSINIKCCKTDGA